MDVATERMYQDWHGWLAREDARARREWQQWDGTISAGTLIADAQTDRINSYRDKHAINDAVMQQFNAHSVG